MYDADYEWYEPGTVNPCDRCKGVQQRYVPLNMGGTTNGVVKCACGRYALGASSEEAAKKQWNSENKGLDMNVERMYAHPFQVRVKGDGQTTRTMCRSETLEGAEDWAAHNLKAGTLYDINDVRECTVENVQALLDRMPDEEKEKLSDGYHTFTELYDHRITLWVTLCYKAQRQNNGMVWRSRLHSDGTAYEGWFVLGMRYQRRAQMTYHIPLDWWDKCKFAKTLDEAPEFDGHTSADVLERILHYSGVTPQGL